MQLEIEVAEKLLEIQAIQLRPDDPFTWASGILSPIYCDNRMVLSYPEVRNFIKESFASLTKKLNSFDVIAGVATAGIAHGALLADLLGKPFLYVREKPKGHGRQNSIEGRLKAGMRVLVIEDLISTGGSSFAAVSKLRESGAEVVGVLAIFSYEFEVAKKLFEENHCPLFTLSNYSALLQVALQKGMIDQPVLEVLQQWRRDPQQWNPNA